MKSVVIIALVASCLIVQSCSVIPVTRASKKNSEIICGGFKAVYTKHAALKDSIVISGNVYDCTDKSFKVPYTMLKLVDKNYELLDTVMTNAKGAYRMRAVPGTYRIMGMRFSVGEVETGLLDFYPQDSVQIDLFLTKSPNFKD